ncbi:OmpA family protein [Comamonadaceae bacterium OH3737_COT-264]|nr:OmpA family protein [Comamonadaceae bacterium OH3737_COT-264]
MLFFLRSFFLSLAVLVLTACQTAPQTHASGLTAEQIHALEEFGFVHIDKGMSYDLAGKILFETDSSDLSEEAKAVIARITGLFKEIGIGSLKLEGHTDNRGADQHNQRLSEQRAQAVADEMVALGQDVHKLKVVGKGASAPIADNATPEGRAENRRVTLVVGVAGGLVPAAK